VINLLFVLAIAAAVGALAIRRLRRRRLRTLAAQRPGAHPGNALAIRTFDEMDLHLRGRLCACGGTMELAGEGSRDLDERRFRVARLVCDECEESEVVFFDTTDLLQ
jgi:hypothetical protein